VVTAELARWEIAIMVIDRPAFQPHPANPVVAEGEGGPASAERADGVRLGY